MNVRLPPFQRVLDEHRDAVHRFLLAAAGPNDADDCFQETFIAALRAQYHLDKPFLDQSSYTAGSHSFGSAGTQVAATVVGAALLLAMPAIQRGLAAIDASHPVSQPAEIHVQIGRHGLGTPLRGSIGGCR